MASSEIGQEFVLSAEQMESIKQSVLNSFLEILPNIINEIAPTIMQSAEMIIKKRIGEVISSTRPFLNVSSTAVKEKARLIENINTKQLNSKLKLRNDTFWQLTRSSELSKLYSECLQEKPSYIPQKFREDSTFKVSEEEIVAYKKLEQHKLSTEIEVLNLRAENYKKKIEDVDGEAFKFFESQEENGHVLKELKETWNKKAKEDEIKVVSKWEKRIKDNKDIYEKEKISKKEEKFAPKKPNHSTNTYVYPSGI